MGQIFVFLLVLHLKKESIVLQLIKILQNRMKGHKAIYLFFILIFLLSHMIYMIDFLLCFLNFDVI